MPRWLAIVSLAGLGVAGGAIASCGGRSSRLSPREELVVAVGPSRFVEGRLTGGFAFAPYPRTGPPPSFSDPAVRRAVQRIADAADRQGGPQALADLGVLRLLEGRFDEAVALLETAAAREPGAPRHRSDLAAACLARARDGSRPGDLVRALAAADRAARDDPSLPEARFNRALALEKLFLITEARRSWQDVVREESGSGWSREAGTRLRRLATTPEAELWKAERERLDRAALQGERATLAALVDRFRQPARRYAEEDLLTSWAENAAAGRTAEAERALRIARAIGAALVEGHGDAMLRDGVAVIDAARSAEPGTCLRCLVRGHLLLGDGARKVRERQLGPVVQILAEAEEQLRRAGSPFALWARFNLALRDYFLPEYARTREALERLRHDVPAGRYPILGGRISYVLGSTDVLTGRAGEALPLVREAEQVFTRAGEIDNLVMTHELHALAFDDLGESEEALRRLLLALRMRDRVHNPGRVFAVLDLMAMVCLRRGEIDVARYFQDELLSHSLNQGNPSFVSFAHQRRASTLSLAGRRVEALRHLDAADREARAIPDPGIRQRQQAELQMLRGELQIAAEPAAAVRSLSQAVAFFEHAGLGYYLSNALFARARAELALEDEAGADLDFRRGLRAIERARDSVPPGSLRMTLYDQATALFDEILLFQARRGAGDRAFEISERVRARQLLDRSAPAGAILGIGEIQRRLPEGTVLLKYALLPDRLLVWAVDRDRVELRQVLLDAGALGARVEQVLGHLRRREAGPALATGLRDLHRTLLSPVAGAIRGARALVVVPDKILHLLPFAALVDPGTGRYLVQDHLLSVAPSANVHVRCLERARAWDGEVPVSALVVAGDRFDRGKFPRLSPLPGAAEEARLVAAAYPRSRLLAGGEATRERFLDLASQGPQVIHFAGHALVNADHPDLSLLVFAGSSEKDGSAAVYSHEVGGLDLGATRLVLLSACSTAAGRVSASEGATSLARSFLAAGVPAVLASLWEVEDKAASRLLTGLHRRLRAGDDPITALRAVQISELGSASPAEWAAFQWIGGAPPHFRKENTSWHSPSN
ncbi:MAG: CHAT domain-containing protein [Thermoanaerobaculia bacterium]